MADNVRFLSGGIGNLDKQPITPGNIYFALSDDKTYGYIVYDFKDSNNSNSRIVMSAKAKTAGQVEFPLVIGEHSYDGSERIEIPIYDGSSESGSECFDISILDNMLVLDNDKIWLFKNGKIDKTAPVDFGPVANESIKALSDRLNNIESDYLSTTDKDQVVTMVSNEALERKAQIGDIGDITVKEYVDNKSYDNRYYTESEIDTKVNALNTAIENSGKFYGIDTSNVLSFQDGNVGSGGRSYTATEDCYVFVYNNHGGNVGSIYINGVYAMALHQSTCSLALKKGQKITVYHGDGGSQIIKLKAFGIKE